MIGGILVVNFKLRIIEWLPNHIKKAGKTYVHSALKIYQRFILDDCRFSFTTGEYISRYI